METGIAASRMKSICLWKISGVSWSKPTMKPPITSIPLSWIRFTHARRSAFTFCILPAARLHSTDGVSIPMNTLLNRAARIRESSSSSSARLIDAWVNRKKGLPRLAIQSVIRGRRPLMACLFPTKLSSTMNTDPRHPRRYSCSNSWRTCCVVLVRGMRPKSSMTSQNSQLKGHPREYWTGIELYLPMRARWKSGGGTRVMSARPAAS